MISRIDRLGMELPPPSDPDPAGAAAVQELHGRQVRRDVDLHELHVPVVQLPRPPVARGRSTTSSPTSPPRSSATSSSSPPRSTRCSPAPRQGRRRQGAQGCARRPEGHRQPAALPRRRPGALPQNSRGNPWNGDYVFSSGDLVEDLPHNFFLETGARNNKLKVYEMVEHPSARALTGYLLVRGGVHQVAYARALEHLTGTDLIEAVPDPADPDGQDPGVQAAHQEGPARHALPVLGRRLPRARCDLERPAPGDRRGARRRGRAARGRAAERPSAAAGRVRRRLRTRGARAKLVEKLRKDAGLPDKPTGAVADA